MFNTLLKQIFRVRAGGQTRNSNPDLATGRSKDVMREATRRFEAGDLAGAQEIAEEAARDDPRCHEAWNLLGAAALAADQHELAVRHFERAMTLQPANADYLSNCGEACRRAGWIDDAIDHCRAAVAAEPGNAGAHYNLGLALFAVGEIEQSRAALTNALAIRPDALAPRSALLFVLCHHPEIEGTTLLEEHSRWDELHARALAPQFMPRAAEGVPGRRLHVGYVSADFRRHSLSYFIEPLLAGHDRDRFEVFCYSNTMHTDEVTDRLRGHVPQWRDITSLSDEEGAALIRRDGIDVLVDLSGHTRGSRLLMFARKPAPVQVSYVGYPNTTGLATMDYRISDGYMDPAGVSDGLYTEKLLRMPHSQWCYRPPVPTPDANLPPALQRGVTTFGSTHSLTKLNGKVLDLWAHLLARAPGTELVIAGVQDTGTSARLHDCFAARGVDAARVHLVGKQNMEDYWKLYHRIDIGLDAFPYTGGTTTCESLWMGVPVVTLAGKYGVARAGASILTGAGLPELIADTPDQYVDIATSLARDPSRLAALRGSLRDRLKRSPLMNETSFTRAFESLLLDAFQAACTQTKTAP